jgi:hypothetical protein
MRTTLRSKERFVKRFILAAVAVLGLAHGARADPRLDEKVYSPYVFNGMAELETRFGRVGGGPLAGASTTVVEAEYGLSDRLSVAAVGAVTHEPGEGTRFAGIGLEAVAYLGQIPRLGVDTGLYLEYTKGLNGADDGLEAKLLLAKTVGRFQGLANLIVERPLGVPKGEGYAAYGYAASATWRTIGHVRLGAEALGDFGDDHRFLGRQGAYVGPQIKWNGRPGKSPVEIEVDAGWLAAVGTSRSEARA